MKNEKKPVTMIMMMMLRNLSISVIDRKKENKTDLKQEKTVKKIYKRVKKSLNKKFGSGDLQNFRNAIFFISKLIFYREQ